MLSSGLSGPEGIAVDGAGNVYVSDSGNNAVIEISPASIAAATSIKSAASKDIYLIDSQRVGGAPIIIDKLTAGAGQIELSRATFPAIVGAGSHPPTLSAGDFTLVA